MPTYLYECTNHGEFEEFHSMSVKLEECPKCIEEKAEPIQKLKRLISSGGSKGVVILTGHELTAKHKEDTAAMKKEIYSNANTYANVIGEAKYHDIQTKMDRRGK